MSEFRPLKPTEKNELFVSMSITGGSGTGKTYSAMLLADGLSGGGKFAVLDTENRRALHYKAQFPNMVHYDFGPGDEGFPPERWIEALEHLAEAKVKAVVVDSFSHSWEGIGGVLELQAQDFERRGGQPKHSQLAWAAVKPRYRRLLEKIIQAPFHVVLCHRGKKVIQQDGRNKYDSNLRRVDIPWAASGDKDLIFEMTASLLFVPEKPGEPILLKCPDHFRGVLNSSSRITRDAGVQLAAWAESGGIDLEAKELLDKADAAARKGKQALNEFYIPLTDAEKIVVKTKLDGLRLIAIEAEELKSTTDLFAGDEPEAAEEEPGPADAPLKERLERALDSCKSQADVDQITLIFEDEISALEEQDPPLKAEALELTSMIKTKRDLLQ